MSLTWQMTCQEAGKTCCFSACRKSGSRYIQPGRLKSSSTARRRASIRAHSTCLLNDSITSRMQRSVKLAAQYSRKFSGAQRVDPVLADADGLTRLKSLRTETQFYP